MLVITRWYKVSYGVIINHNPISWVKYNDLTATEPWESWFGYREIIPFYGRKIQVGELF